MKKFIPLLSIMCAGTILSAPNVSLTDNKNLKADIDKISQSMSVGKLDKPQINAISKVGNYTISTNSTLEDNLSSQDNLDESQQNVVPEEISNANISSKDENNSNNLQYEQNTDIDDKITNSETIQDDNLDTSIEQSELDNNNNIDSQESEQKNNDDISTEQNEQDNSNDVAPQQIEQNNTDSQNTDLTNPSSDNENMKNENSNVAEDNEKTTDNSISTLYSLSNDIDAECDEYCKLKDSLTSAIIETNNLVGKLQDDTLSISEADRINIANQAEQLKHLCKQLAISTTELNIHLSDINKIFTSNNVNLDSLSLKYLLILDNLVNGNEMLHSGLNSLNLINRMYSEPLRENELGRVSYGYRYNNEQPEYKSFSIDKDGKINEISDEKADNEDKMNNEVDSNNNTKKGNIDTYIEPMLKTNIDTLYGNQRKNIDSFYNTALFDNEFMYGGNGYGYNMYGMNPYMNNANGNYIRENQNNNPAEQNSNNTRSSDTQSDSTQNKRKRKKFKLNKNVDTYKDENTPSPKARINNFRESVNEFFAKFSKPNKRDNVQNPIYKFSDEETNSNK